MRKSYFIILFALGACFLFLYSALTTPLTGSTGKRADTKKEQLGQATPKGEKQPGGAQDSKAPQDKSKRDGKGWPPRGGKPTPKIESARGPIGLKLRKGQARYDGTIKESDDKYKDVKNARFFFVRFEFGKTYQIDHKSGAFDAYLYLENPDGELVAQDDDSGGNLNARIIHEANRTGVYRIVATHLGGLGSGVFSLSVRLLSSSGPGGLPKGLPQWFIELDTDEDGQISLPEWRATGKQLDEFRAYDLNDDGFITPDEVLRYLNNAIEPKSDGGPMKFKHAIEETTAETYRGKRAFKTYPVKLEQGKTYQIECVSKDFWAFLYLEDPEGELLAEHNSGGNDKVSRIVHRATKTGTYRLIATSLGGFRTGSFSFSVQVVPGPGGGSVLPKGVPSWFKDLDKDGDGQVSLAEWRAGGKKLDEFRDYDLNDDGLITAEEVLRFLSRPMELPTTGQTSFSHSLPEPTEERHRGKMAYKVYTVRMEKGKAYQIDLTSKMFQAFLYLEDAKENLLQEHSSPTVGGNSRIIHYASESGTYRIIATSQGGFRTGDYTLSIRVTGD